MLDHSSNNIEGDNTSFAEQILSYLQTQLEYEEADIELHKHMTLDEKVSQGLVIRDLGVIAAQGNEYVLHAEEDNSKLRVGDSVKVYYAGHSGKGRITDIGIDSISIYTEMSLPSDEKINIEVMEFIFLQPMINLMEKIVTGDKVGSAFIDILEGSRAPILQGLGALPKPEWDIEQEFNEMQKDVITEACQRPSVYCIQGPPGTGKTAVLSEIASQFASNGKEVLIIANTHQAVNNALNKIAVQSPQFKIVKVGEAMLSSHLHPIVYAYKKYSDYLTERKQQKRSKRGDVIGMTLHASVVNLGLRNAAFRPQIVLVDEAGQIPMPYASIIGSFGCGSVIFIGDDKQMPPIFHPNLVGDKFSKSIFKYLCDKYPQLRKTLNVTYRMNDEITELVSGLFYDTSSEHIIKSSESASKRRTDYSSLTGVQDGFYKNLLSSNESIIFADVNPSTESTSEDSNIYEATACAELAKIFDANGIKSDDYAIITPYRRQVKLIKSLIGSDNSPLVDTVECLQGQDVNTIIISFVAVSPAYVREQIDFLLNQNRLNVMISRAKTKVIVFMSKLLQYELFRRFKIDANSYSGLKIISSEF